MKMTVSIAAAAAVLSAASAQAQDWSGPYLGGQIGFGWSDSEILLRGPGASDYFPVHPNGVFGGIYAGYSHQIVDRIVLGAEVDIAASAIDGDAALYSGGTNSPSVGNSATAQLRWAGALRARLGYAFDRFLPYVAAGVAFGEYEVLPLYSAAGPVPGENIHTGWTVGAGVEIAVSDNLTTRMDYRYSDYGSATYDIPGFGAYDTHAELETHDLRFGVAYKF